MATKTGTRKIKVLGRTFTGAEWSHLSDVERETFLVAEKMMSHLSSSNRSKIGLELDLPRFPGREDYVTWLHIPGNLARGKRMVGSWWSNLLGR